MHYFNLFILICISNNKFIYIYYTSMYELLIWLILTILFLLYIQFSPDMGNIWLRSGYFMPMGAIKMIIYPFKEIHMWLLPEMWIVNYWIWMIPFLMYILYNWITRLLSNSTNSSVITTSIS